MAIEETRGEIILLDDFNAYYLIWGKKHIASEEQAEHFLAKTNAKGFILAILKGKPIQKKGQQESVIDFIFISPNLYRKINFYSIVKE